MSVTQSFKMALNALRSSKMRSFLTMLGIIMGVAAVIIIISLGNGLTGMVEQQVEKVGVNQLYLYDWGIGGGARKLDAERVCDLVDSRPDLFTGVTPWVSTAAAVRRGEEKLEKTAVYGVSEAMFNLETGRTLDGDALAKGRYLSYVDVRYRQNVCIAGAYLEDACFRGDALGKTLSIGGEPYTIVGVLQPAAKIQEEGCGDDVLYIPYENALRFNASRNVDLYQVTAVSREASAAAKEALTALLEDFYGVEDVYYAGRVQSMAEQVEMINGMMAIAMAVLVAIAAISLMVGGIGIMNIMLVSVTERTREIGIRKSLGARRRDIRRQFIIEAGTTSALGGLLGIALGFLMSTALGALFGEVLVEALTGGVSGVTFDAAPSVGAVAVSFGVSVGIGVLFGYLPANRAAKLNPIDALRHE